MSENIIRHLPVLLIIIPLMGGILVPLINRFFKKGYVIWSIGVCFVSFIISGILTLQVAQNGPIQYILGGKSLPFVIELSFDYISAFSLVILFIGLLIVIFSHRYAEKFIPAQKVPAYYSILLIIFSAMVGFVCTADIFNLYLFLEIISLASYVLVSFGRDRLSSIAAFKYLLVGTVASICIFFGIVLLYTATGTLNMLQLATILPTLDNFRQILGFSLVFFVVGFSIKAAVFPLHLWLPDAHSYAPSPVSAVLSGLVVKIGILGFIRVVFLIYKVNQNVQFVGLGNILMYMSFLAIFISTTLAIFQKDIKMMFAYSTVANIGYILLGLSLFSIDGIRGGLIHILNHSVTKAALFLCAGAIVFKTGTRKIAELNGVGKKMPITAFCLTISALSIIGIPPSGGFISKWYIALGVLEKGRPVLMFLFLLGSILTAVYYLRIINVLFFKKAEAIKVKEENTLLGADEMGGFDIEEEVKSSDEGRELETKGLELPVGMLIPIIILGICSFLVGIFAVFPVKFIEPLLSVIIGIGSGK